MCVSTFLAEETPLRQVSPLSCLEVLRCWRGRTRENQTRESATKKNERVKVSNSFPWASLMKSKPPPLLPANFCDRLPKPTHHRRSSLDGTESLSQPPPPPPPSPQPYNLYMSGHVCTPSPTQYTGDFFRFLPPPPPLPTSPHIHPAIKSGFQRIEALTPTDWS